MIKSFVIVSIVFVLGYLFGIVSLLGGIRKNWPELYADLRYRVFKEEDDEAD